MYKWRNEKSRITAVFKLQFHATQVSEGLVISVIPAENGKPTATLENSTVKNNGCYWENPVYVTVKFLQDSETSKIQDRIYYFLVSTGASGNLVGEFRVNVANYIAKYEPCSVSFPFKKCFSHSYFHVTIQRIEDNSNLSTVQRDLQINEGLRIKQKDKSLRQQFSNGDFEQGTHLNFVGDQPLRKTASHSVGLNGTQIGWNGSNTTSRSSDSSSGHNTPREPGVTNAHPNIDETSNSPGYQDQQKMQWDLAIVAVNDSSTELSMNSPQDFFPSLRDSMGFDDSVDKLRAELVAISRRAEVLELESQTLRKQIVKESKRGQELSAEVSCLKEERNAYKDECEKLKSFQKRSEELTDKSKFQIEGDPWTLIEVTREELNREKEMNANLRLQMQNIQDLNKELILAVQDLEEMLEKNSKRVSHLPTRSISGESDVEIEESILNGQSDEESQKALEDLVKQHSDDQETYMLEQKIMDLCSEIEMCKRDRDELEMQMEQLALDYEILKQQNHEFTTILEQNHLQEELNMQCDGSSSYGAMREHESHILKLENELKEKAEELSHCLAEMKDLEARNIVLQLEILKQAERFEDDMITIRSTQMDLQERAAHAEVALNESDAIISELETLILMLKKERKKHLEELSSSLTAITELKNQNHHLKEELELQKQKYEADMEALDHQKMEQEHWVLEAEEAVNSSCATINELEDQIKELGNELKKHSEEPAKLASVKELKAHIDTLEDDMETEAERFEADPEAVTRAKVEQDHRAIRAEESLRLVKWKNANWAVRIQDEFKILSSQMQSSFEANENLDSKDLTRATGLCLHNHHLKNFLQKAQEELRSTKDECETKLHEKYHQLNTKSSQIEQMEVQIAGKSKAVDNHKKLTGESQRTVSDDQIDQSSQIERLTLQKKSIAELFKEVIEERDFLAQGDNMMCGNSVMEMDGRYSEEMNLLRNLKDEKEQIILMLKSELEELTVQCDNFKNSLHEDEWEKETIREQLFQLKAGLKKKHEAIWSIEKKLKEYSENIEVVQEKPLSGSEGSTEEVGSNEVATLRERVKLLEENEVVGIQVDCDLCEEAIITDENSNMESKSHVETDSQPTLDNDSGNQQKIDIRSIQRDELVKRK